MEKFDEKIGIHCFVTGKVQGVWFRASTQEQANQLGITGWAKNLSDGRVEVLAFGTKAQLDALYEWLKKGPELSKVIDVTYETVPWDDHSDFQTK